MSPEPEKRSDEQEAAAHAILDALVDAGHNGMQCNDYAPLTDPVVAAVRALPVWAALAASRAERERVGEWIDDYKREQEAIIERWMNDAAAARVEVSQLRAKIERVERLHDDTAGFPSIWRDVLGRALAEPLGSTPDQPATEEKRETIDDCLDEWERE